MAYSGVYVFGDSLVDAGNALKLAEWYGDLTFSDLPDGAPTEEEGYFEGRFSNGYTFADLLANKAIGTITEPVFPYGYEDPWLGIPISPWSSDPNGNNLNFAYGGAQIRQGDEVVPDLDGQTDTFRDAVDGDADPNALYLIAIGGNDVRNLAPSGGDPVSPADGYAALDKAAEKYLTELSQLVAMGARHIVITGVPDVGLIPRYDRDGNLVLDAAELLRSEAATDFSIYLDTLIRTEVVPALQALGATVTYVPLMDYVDSSGNLVTGALNANLATIAALHGLTADELSDNLLQHQDLLFFDQIHPNAQANALLGAYMHAQLTGTAWVETLPLTGAEVDYRMSGSIASPGEVDKLVVALVAGTTYTLDLLGMSSLGISGSLADPALRLLGPSGTLFGSNADDGAGFDSTLTFTAATTGNYTIEILGTGTPTGSYVLQAAVIGGAATLAGNTYTVSNAATVVLEGAGGIGQDVVKASVSYALSEGSEIEVLRTTHDKGKTAINLTGNEFDQTIVGNSAANVLEGKAGADVLVGGAGKDVFVLSNAAVTDPGAANIDTISDYAAGDVVDVTQILSVAAGTDVLAGGFLRVTTGGLV
ncbi:MAG TPA: SGNH/GDSL hydrolase family protein, partial [Sphingomicrobium sp.]|nr:SGNH/GDSL hydrolase family protein [Sphingomicrobium sp.]